MKAPPFAYARPETLAQVFELLREHGDGAKILAGGQSLMATLNMRLSAPDVLIDINRIDGLAGISVDGGNLRIGALTRHAEVMGSPEVAEHAPLIAQAMPHIAHPAIRNRGTFGGSVAFADPAAELPACVVALGADLVLEGPGGQRRVAADDFFQGLYDTALADDEILVAAEIPSIASGYKSGFMELSRRHGDYAIIGLAAHGRIDGGSFSDMRLVYFGAGDRPVVARSAAAALDGQSTGDDALEAAAAKLDDDLDPPEDLNADGPMRLHLARVLLRRTLGAMVNG